MRPPPKKLSEEDLARLQQRVSEIPDFWFDALHKMEGVPDDFRPWESGLSPSALYSCSLKCRKAAKVKTPEVKWMNIKRWVTTTPLGVELPKGVYFSIKRHEHFVSLPEPHLEKTEFVLLLLPFGNVWSQTAPPSKDEFHPIDEEWMWSEEGGIMMFERLVRRDAAEPVPGYFKRVLRFMEKHPDQIGIHLKRKKRR